MAKRGRDEGEAKVRTTSELLHQASQSPLKTSGSTEKSDNHPLERRLALIRRTTVAEREVIFKSVLDINEAVLVEMLQKTMTESDKLGESPVKDVIEKQLFTIRSLNWIVVSELAKMCGILSDSSNEAATMVHICSVIREEITRLKSPKLVFQLLQSIAKVVDEQIASKQIDVLIGSLYESMQFTFSFVKKLLVQKKTAGDSKALPAASSDLTNSIIRRPTHLASIFTTSSGATKRACREVSPKGSISPRSDRPNAVQLW